MDPEQLEEAVRRADFTPTSVRLWVEGTLVEWTPPGDTGLESKALVSTGSDQRFALRVGSDPEALAALEAAGSGTVTLEGIVEKLEGVEDLVLALESEEPDG